MNDLIRAESVLIKIFSLEKVNFSRLEQQIEALLYNVLYMYCVNIIRFHWIEFEYNNCTQSSSIGMQVA